MQALPHILEKRKRGGQPGNKNRLRHGRYTEDFAQRRAAINRSVAKAKALLVRVEMVLRMRRALKEKLRKRNRPHHLPLWGGRTNPSGAKNFSGGGSALTPHPDRFALRPPTRGR